MAKDRAKDSKRVPNLGISDPISHVKTISAPKNLTELSRAKSRNGRDSYGHTDEARTTLSKHDARMTEMRNDEEREQAQTNVVKINSNPSESK